MILPNLSHLVTVGQLRHIQSVYEAPAYRNPDFLVGNLLTVRERWACAIRGRVMIGKLREDPFYYYLLARTKYYDAIVTQSLRDRISYIVNIGCGSDTRAYRFGAALNRQGTRVVECDQPAAILAKQQIAKRHWSVDHVEYLAIDLNASSWPDFEQWLRRRHGVAMSVMMEGVSPHVEAVSFGRFLDLLAIELCPGSRIAYDAKLHGMSEDLGRSVITPNPFRLPSGRDEIAAFHRARGYQVGHLELSADLSLRMLPRLPQVHTPLFREDVLVQLLLSKAYGVG